MDTYKSKHGPSDTEKDPRGSKDPIVYNGRDMSKQTTNT